MSECDKNMTLANMKKIVERYPNEKRHSLAILQDFQKEYNYIPEEALNLISEYLDMPLSKLYGMATFYKALSLNPKGKNIITVCDGTACHVRGSFSIICELEKVLKIKVEETTEDGMFTLETVGCLGACALAPVMMINGKYYGKMTPKKIKEIIEEYRGDKGGK
ncbi:NADH-quinone oxidoreductase subunit NuoE [Clostridium sediminicola]|uniref:NADH-quinone oxidoreductase subunit NuoE n=1 Tax=Clostridium sediminicola TaxID=3114879 RepID=UPI0031F2140B